MRNINLQKRAALYSTYWVVTVCLATLSVSPVSGHSLRYRVVLLGDRGADIEMPGNTIWPWRLNNRGDMIGGSTRGLFISRGSMVRYLEYSEEPYAFLMNINDRGVIIGSVADLSRDWPENASTFILRSSGSIRNLDLAKARILPFPAFFAVDINDQGTMVGALESRNAQRKAMVYEDGRLRELPGLMPGGDNFPAAINNRGQIIGSAQVAPHSGYRPVIWSKGRLQDLGRLPGFYTSYGTAINDYGVAVGWCGDSESVIAGFIYRNGELRLLPFPAGARHFTPTCINNTGDVLCCFYPRRHGDFETYWLYSRGHLHDLTPIVARTTGLPVQSLDLSDMNDHGVIVGTCQYQENGQRYAQGIVMIPEERRDADPPNTKPNP